MIVAALLVSAVLSAALAAAPGVATGATAATAPSAAPVAGPANLAPPDGTYIYSILQGGSEVGKSTLAIQRAAIGITAHETETLAPSYAFDINEIFDPATLAPRAFTGVYARGSSSSTVRVAVDRGGAVVTIEGAPGAAPFPNPPGVKDTYLLEGILMSGFAMLPAEIHASQATQFSQVAPRSVLQAVRQVDPHPSAIRPSGVAAGDAVLSVTGQVSFDVWYDPATFVVHALSVPGQQILATLTK